MTRSKENYSGSESVENSCAESVENSDCGDSVKSTSPSPSPAAEKRILKEVNGMRDLAAGTKALRTAVPSDGARFLCCLLTTQRKEVQLPSDKNAER